MTDEGLYYDENGAELRRFHVLDGLGLQNLMAKGMQVRIISRSTTKAVLHRANALGIIHCYLGVINKLEAMKKLIVEMNISLNEVAHIGDDINDLQLMQVAGLPVTVPKAVIEIKNIAKLITERNGGDEAVRELADKILESKVQ